MPSSKVTAKKHLVWNELDSWGLPFGVERLPMESNREFRDRLLSVIKANGDASHQGIVDGLSAFFQLKTYNADGNRHFYFRLTPQEYDADGNTLDVKVYINGAQQTQNIEYASPKDWMHGGRGNYVFDEGAEGFIVWRDSNGHYTNHLEFLVSAPTTYSEIKLDYWAKIDDDYIHVVETSSENNNLEARSAETPAGNQIKVQQLFDSDFLDEHTTALGTPDNTLQGIVREVSDAYPFQWGSFRWDKFSWAASVNQGILPSYYDGVTDSGNFYSGTGHGEQLKVIGLDALGQPKIRPGYVYYAGDEYYMYRLMDYQEAEQGIYDVTLTNESGDYINITRPAPIVVRTETSRGMFIGHPGPLIAGESESFPYDNEDPSNTEFSLTAGTPQYPDYIMAKRFNSSGDYWNESGFIYNSGPNSVTTQEALIQGQELWIGWPVAASRYVLRNSIATGYNFAPTHQEGHRTVMEELITEDTFDSDFASITEGDHRHYVRMTNPRINTGELHPEVWAESGNVAPISGVTTPFVPDSTGYMQLEHKAHEHTIVNGIVGSGDIVLDDGTILKHTHSITIPDNFGWLERTPALLPHKPDPKSIPLASPAAQTYLATAWDNLILDTDTRTYGYFKVRPESGSLRLDIVDSDVPHTIFYERGTYTPDDDYTVLPPAYCPSLYYAQGKLLVVGRHLPPVDLTLYPERAVFWEWDKELGITVEAIDSEGKGLVSDVSIKIEPGDDYTIIDMNTDKAVTSLHGTVYVRPTISEGATAITKGDTVTLKITGVFVTKDRYEGPLPSTVTMSQSGVPGDETYNYTIVKTLDLTWVG